MSENEELYKRMTREFNENHPLLVETYESYRTGRAVFEEYLSHRQPVYITRVDTGATPCKGYKEVR